VTIGTNTRLSMKSNLKVLLSALGVAALLASPAMAKTARYAAPTAVYHARGFVAPYGAAEGRLPKYVDHSNIYESESQGHQSFPNPDRVLPAPDHYE
jgi:hypothetical protein